MLLFLDETYRESSKGHKLGALCGVAIPEDLFAKVAQDVYSMKFNSFGEEFARDRELKGAILLKARNFDSPQTPHALTCLHFVQDLLRYLARNRVVVFGVVCFDDSLRDLRCHDPQRLEPSYRSLFERLDNYMRLEFPRRRAKLVFDDVDHGTNESRAASITNFFNRSAIGRGYDTIIRTPFFAVSQAQNVGLQLADVVTTICGMRFQGRREVLETFRMLKATLYRYVLGGRHYSSLKVFKSTGA